MSLLQELKNRLIAREHLPDELTIRDDQVDTLADELSGLQIHPMNVSGADIRNGKFFIFGIPLRVLNR